MALKTKQLKAFLYIIISIACMMTCVSCKKNYLEEFLKSSCDAPCWNGIEIGMKKAQVKQVLENEIGHDYTEREFPNNYSTISIQKKQGQRDIVFGFREDSLTAINFLIYRDCTLSLEELISWYGAPEYVLGWHVHHALSSSQLILCCPGKGIEAKLESTMRTSSPYQTINVSKSTKVKAVYYFHYYDPNNETEPTRVLDFCETPRCRSLS